MLPLTPEKSSSRCDRLANFPSQCNQLKSNLSGNAMGATSVHV